MNDHITAHRGLEPVEGPGNFDILEKKGVTLDQVKASCAAGHYLYQHAFQLTPGSRVRVYGENYSFFVDFIVTDKSRRENRVTTELVGEKVFHEIGSTTITPAVTPVQYEARKRDNDNKWFVFDVLADQRLNEDLFNTKKEALASLAAILETA